MHEVDASNLDQILAGDGTSQFAPVVVARRWKGQFDQKAKWTSSIEDEAFVSDDDRVAVASGQTI